MRGGQAGRARERQVADSLRADDWVVLKGTTYGICDLVAMKDGERPMVIEVKSTAGSAYERFGPADRAALKDVAKRAGAVAVLAWWPPRGKLMLLDEAVWP